VAGVVWFFRGLHLPLEYTYLTAASNPDLFHLKDWVQPISLLELPRPTTTSPRPGSCGRLRRPTPVPRPKLAPMPTFKRAIRRRLCALSVAD